MKYIYISAKDFIPLAHVYTVFIQYNYMSFNILISMIILIDLLEVKRLWNPDWFDIISFPFSCCLSIIFSPVLRGMNKAVWWLTLTSCIVSLSTLAVYIGADVERWSLNRRWTDYTVSTASVRFMRLAWVCWNLFKSFLSVSISSAV